MGYNHTEYSLTMNWYNTMPKYVYSVSPTNAIYTVNQEWRKKTEQWTFKWRTNDTCLIYVNLHLWNCITLNICWQKKQSSLLSFILINYVKENISPFKTSWYFCFAGNTGTAATRETATSFPSSFSHPRTRLPSTFERAETDLISKTNHKLKRRRLHSHVWVRSFQRCYSQKDFTTRFAIGWHVAVVIKRHPFEINWIES